MKVRHVDFSHDEWLGGTFELSFEERGVYITACALIYSRGGPIDKELIFEHGRHHRRSYKRIVSRLVELGKLDEKDGKLDQKRCETELKLAQNRVETSRKNGEKGGRPPNEINEIEEPAGFSDEKLIPPPPPIPTTSTKEEDSDSLRRESDRVAVSDGLGMKSDLYGRCLVWLSDHTGKSQNSLRSTVGKWIKDYGDSSVIAAFDVAMRYNPIEPIAYILKVLQKPHNNGHRVLNKHNMSGFIPMHPGAGG